MFPLTSGAAPNKRKLPLVGNEAPTRSIKHRVRELRFAGLARRPLVSSFVKPRTPQATIFTAKEESLFAPAPFAKDHSVNDHAR